tara:strand:+ start:1949 stop:2815 length:867 start_codon:yes stop_codon:yes gene_type:complete
MSTFDVLNAHLLNDQPLLDTDKSRDIPPLGSGHARTTLLHIEDNTLFVAAVCDVDPQKPHHSEGKMFGLPGGRQKDGCEKYIVTARKELREEAGADVPRADLYPVCRFVQHNVPLRDKLTDKEMLDERGQLVRGDIDFYMFAHCGFVELRETTDSDTREPLWIPVEEALGSSKLRRSQKKLWPSHVIALVYTLIYIGIEFEKYKNGCLKNRDDMRFFASLVRDAGAGESSKHFYQAIDFISRLSLSRLDILSIMTNYFYGDAARAVGNIANFEPYPLGCDRYFTTSGG